MVLRGATGSVGHAFEFRWVAEDGDSASGHAVNIADFVEQAVDAVFYQLGNAADAGGYGGDTAGHGFECGEAEGLWPEW